MGFPCGSDCNVGDLGSFPRLGRSPGEGKIYSLQYSGLDNSMDCLVHGVTKSWTRLSAFHFRSLPLNIKMYKELKQLNSKKQKLD